VPNIHFTKLAEPTTEIVAALNKWENDPQLIPFARPNNNQADLDRREHLSLDDMVKRLQHHQTYLIYLEGQLIGEMNYQIDPGYLYKKEAGTAWLGITIGEEMGRGRGIGYQAMQFLEAQIKQHSLKRIELGVFEFNTNAIKLYQRLGYKEIGRIDAFTYWQERLWQDIRMEKYV
jgi:RimJ/RimL family protein N-acetyltransferase